MAGPSHIQLTRLVDAQTLKLVLLMAPNVNAN